LKGNLRKTKSDNKSFYAYVRSKSIKSRVRPGPLVDDDDDVITSAQEMSEKFNGGFFASARFLI